MKTILIIILTLFIVSSQSVYAQKPEPIQMGSFVGAYPYTIKARNGVPFFDAALAGNFYLLKNKIDVLKYVVNAKTTLIKNALRNAKKYAQNERKKYFAVDNMHFQVLHTETKVEVYLDCDLIAFN